MSEKTLHLTLKREWFDMIQSGEKREEYREIKEHWIKRLLEPEDDMEAAVLWELIADMKHPYRHRDYDELMAHFRVHFRKYDSILFANGYHKARPVMRVKLKGIRIGEGRPEWGALPGVNYFVLELGEVLR